MPLYINGRGRCQCGYPLDHHRQCAACRIRRAAGLPDDARCGSCRHRRQGKCLFMTRNAVCSKWEPAAVPA